MRSLWSGALSFGLINIPIKLYSAVQEHEGISFDMLHKKDLSPIRYARICKADGKEVPYQDIVKGYEYQDGDYVVITEEDFKQADAEKTKAIDIVAFVDGDEVDTIYYDKPYFLESGKGADKAYVLLCEALKKSKKVGIARYVFHQREHIGVLKPYDNILILNQLRYASEIKDLSDLRLPEANITQKEVTMALKLIEHLTSHFKPEEYHDTYTEALKKAIKEKTKGKKPRVVKGKGKKAPKEAKVQDILKLLKDSLEAA